MKIARLIALSLALSFAPCTAHAQGKSAPKDAVLYFVWPQDGTVIKRGFWCRFGLRNMGVTHAGDDFHNSGHHHLLIDVTEPLDPNEPIPQDKSHLHFGAGQTEARMELPPGLPSLASFQGCSLGEIDLAQDGSDEPGIPISNGSVSRRSIPVCGVLLAGARRCIGR